MNKTLRSITLSAVMAMVSLSVGAMNLPKGNNWKPITSWLKGSPAAGKSAEETTKLISQAHEIVNKQLQNKQADLVKIKNEVITWANNIAPFNLATGEIIKTDMPTKAQNAVTAIEAILKSIKKVADEKAAAELAEKNRIAEEKRIAAEKLAKERKEAQEKAIRDAREQAAREQLEKKKQLEEKKRIAAAELAEENRIAEEKAKADREAKAKETEKAEETKNANAGNGNAIVENKANVGNATVDNTDKANVGNANVGDAGKDNAGKDNANAGDVKKQDAWEIPAFLQNFATGFFSWMPVAGTAGNNQFDIEDEGNVQPEGDNAKESDVDQIKIENVDESDESDSESQEVESWTNEELAIINGNDKEKIKTLFTQITVDVIEKRGLSDDQFIQLIQEDLGSFKLEESEIIPIFIKITKENLSGDLTDKGLVKHEISTLIGELVIARKEATIMRYVAYATVIGVIVAFVTYNYHTLDGSILHSICPDFLSQLLGYSTTTAGSVQYTAEQICMQTGANVIGVTEEVCRNITTKVFSDMQITTGQTISIELANSIVETVKQRTLDFIASAQATCGKTAFDTCLNMAPQLGQEGCKIVEQKVLDIVGSNFNETLCKELAQNVTNVTIENAVAVANKEVINNCHTSVIDKCLKLNMTNDTCIDMANNVTGTLANSTAIDVNNCQKLTEAALEQARLAAELKAQNLKSCGEAIINTCPNLDPAVCEKIRDQVINIVGNHATITLEKCLDAAKPLIDAALKEKTAFDIMGNQQGHWVTELIHKFLCTQWPLNYLVGC